MRAADLTIGGSHLRLVTVAGSVAQPFGFCTGLPGWPAGGVALGRGAFGAGFGAGVPGLGCWGWLG